MMKRSLSSSSESSCSPRSYRLEDRPVVRVELVGPGAFPDPRRLERIGIVGRPREAGLEHDRPGTSARLLGGFAIGRDQLRRGLRVGKRPEPVAVPTGNRGGTGMEGRDVERWRLFGSRVQVRPLRLEEPSFVVDVLAL